MSDEPLVQNASDPKQVRAAGKKARANERELTEQVRTVLGTVQGRRWYWDRMSECGVFLSVFDPNPYQHAFNEGFRNAGLMLLKQVNLVDPALVAQMRNEAESKG